MARRVGARLRPRHRTARRCRRRRRLLEGAVCGECCGAASARALLLGQRAAGWLCHSRTACRAMLCAHLCPPPASHHTTAQCALAGAPRGPEGRRPLAAAVQLGGPGLYRPAGWAAAGRRDARRQQRERLRRRRRRARGWRAGARARGRGRSSTGAGASPQRQPFCCSAGAGGCACGCSGRGGRRDSAG